MFWDQLLPHVFPLCDSRGIIDLFFHLCTLKASLKHMSVRCYGYRYERSQGPEKDPRIFALLSLLVFAAVVTSAIVLNADVIRNNMKVR